MIEDTEEGRGGRQILSNSPSTREVGKGVERVLSGAWEEVGSQVRKGS